MFRSATFKLTMYYLLIIAFISIGFSIMIYQVASKDMANGLERQTQRIIDRFPVFSGSPYLHPDGTDLHEGQQHLIGRLVLLNAVVLVGAGFASYGLARRTLRPIEEAHERQKRFTADVSHELRTPLTSLKMESEVALMDPKASKSELQDALASNIEEVEKLTNLVGDLLRLSQLDDRDNPMPLETVSADELVAAAISQLQPTATNRKITLAHTPADNVYVRADRPTFTQMIVILLDNAIKYSPANKTVTISTSQEQGIVSIAIADSGVGIPKSDLEHVFERFYRADQSRTSGGESSGFGLGLSIAQQIAEHHNAGINLTSRVGKGTTATVSLPAAEQEATAVASPPTNTQP